MEVALLVAPLTLPLTALPVVRAANAQPIDLQPNGIVWENVLLRETRSIDGADRVVTELLSDT